MTYLLIAFSYLMGSIPFSLVWSRLFRLRDPRTYGSRNLGTTNIMRSGHKTATALTLLADFGKGAIPITIAHIANLPDNIIVVVGVAAIVGHIFSAFLRFKGGKGVATTLGVFFSWEIHTGLVISLLWLAFYLILRVPSLCSIITIAISPLVFFRLTPEPFAIGSCIVLCLIIFSHIKNIKNLLQGKERKFPRKKIVFSDVENIKNVLQDKEQEFTRKK